MELYLSLIFLKKRSEALSNQYKLNRQEFPPRGKYYRFHVGLNNLDVFNVAVDPMMLTTLANYYGCQPYLRGLPVINSLTLELKKILRQLVLMTFGITTLQIK